MYRFVNNCRPRQHTRRGHLSTLELNAAEEYWLKVMQGEMFGEELSLLQDGKELPRKSKLLSLRPFVDAQGLLRVGGRASLSKLSYSRRHPIILPSDHVLTKLIVHSEHLRLLHAGPTLTSAVHSFIAASDLSAVPKFYLPRASGGYSEPIYIQVGFPFGNTTSVVHSVVYVSNTADKYVWSAERSLQME